MSLIVQKFGGTSVADAEKIRTAARRAIRAQQAGNQVVMVVSAMGKNTDLLVDLAAQVCQGGGDAPAREMDMLLSTGEQVSVALMAMAVHDLGAKAVSLTGGQIGIHTDSSHTKARIRSISTERVRKLLDAGNIVIACGFQGIDDDWNITTLGRGGSDTSAVALAAVLGASQCEIYTDVDGVFTTDPRLVAEARKMDRVSHDEMLELASLGAGVMHSRSIEFGKKFCVPIHVKNSAVFTDEPGTVISTESECADRPVSGAALTKDEARVTVRHIPDQPGTSQAIFSRLAAKNVTVDMIVQNLGAGGTADISFTVPESDLKRAMEALREATAELGGGDVSYDEDVAKISIVGLGMATQSGVADRMFRSLAEMGINIIAITTSDIKVSVLVERARMTDALRAVHREFELDKPPHERATFGEPTTPGKQADAVDVVAKLQHMEDLTIHGVALDTEQARVSISNVTDVPGIAAEVFEAVASQGVLVDMIVQSVGEDGRTNLSFTVPQNDLAKAGKIIQELIDRVGGEMTTCDKIAILTVTGVGIRSHTGVGTRMFQALYDAGINVDMISTSEVRVNVVVDGPQGETGLAALKQVFADVIER
ncbi:aspartate kinase [Aeoliella mucimassa]|uniref:aspartate kinase n=1 Tax=Aeoliella mucimassa TaxID=2527972 RepID=A0A518ASY4_9BACT|nr:aspartate kinase [Aeoliella mucimassa]QDU57838.1 Aspartokinase [Aeoliella mucimassa]